jgi:hypothetical protein
MAPMLSEMNLNTTADEFRKPTPGVATPFAVTPVEEHLPWSNIGHDGLNSTPSVTKLLKDEVLTKTPT